MGFTQIDGQEMKGTIAYLLGCFGDVSDVRVSTVIETNQLADQGGSFGGTITKKGTQTSESFSCAISCESLSWIPIRHARR